MEGPDVRARSLLSEDTVLCVQMVYRMIEEVADNRRHLLTDSIAVNTKNAIIANESNDRSSRSLELMYARSLHVGCRTCAWC